MSTLVILHANTHANFTPRTLRQEAPSRSYPLFGTPVAHAADAWHLGSDAIQVKGTFAAEGTMYFVQELPKWSVCAAL